MSRQFIRFALAGGLGFVVDASVLYLMLALGNAGPKGDGRRQFNEGYMRIPIMDTPRTLLIDAEAAERDGMNITFTPERVKRMAELWHADLEKIAYLESLIFKIGRS